jgi:hypothetical protein
MVHPKDHSMVVVMAHRKAVGKELWKVAWRAGLSVQGMDDLMAE